MPEDGPDKNSPIGLEQAGIGTVLKRHLLYVPPNQRGYAWTEREVIQLYSDIADAIRDRADYFLGTIVTIVRSHHRLEVVDGQQRLATTAMLLAAIREYLQDIDEKKMGQVIQGEFLSGTDHTRRGEIPRLTLSSADHDHFRAIISSDSEAEVPAQSLASHRRLLEAYELAREYVKQLARPYDVLSQANHLNSWVNYLEYRALVVLLQVQNDADAYRMFETLNDRGLRTSQADLIKNYLFSRAGDRLGEVQNSWTQMRGVLESVEDDDITITFLRHALIVQQGYLKESDVYRVTQNAVRSEEDSVSFAATLDRLAGTYVAISNSDHQTWNSAQYSSRDAIRVLNLLNIRPIVPVMLSVGARIESARERSASFDFLISLGVRLLIASSTRSGAVERPLAAAAHDIWMGNIDCAESLKSTLSSITPTDAAFQRAFESASISNARLARYYLRSLEMAHRNESEPWYIPTDDGTIINLEHVLPQNPTGDWQQFSDDEFNLYKRRLGNLVLMQASGNSAIGANEFAQKKQAYADSPYDLTSEVSEYAEWTRDSIQSRQEKLAELSVKAWPVS